ncbi:unnamed protein product [Closterium sp. Yama58-4]|nr:unnamed protein product [Closterium sp. Yama58-4]
MRPVSNRETEQAIIAMKKGSRLDLILEALPDMVSPFLPTQDECDLVYISGDREKTFPLANVSQILWGQRTGSFARSSRSDKDNQSFSLIFSEGERPLDVVWKDTEEAEMWYTGLRVLVERNRRPKSERLGLSHRRSTSMSLDEAGEAFLWGDGRKGRGLLGEGGYEDMPQWVPRRVGGALDGLYLVQVACGPWHVAAVAATGQLFTFGDGTFGALGHGNCDIVSSPKEVESLRGTRVSRVACGVWHTAAVVHAPSSASSSTAAPSEAATTAPGVTSEGDSAGAGAAVAADAAVAAVAAGVAGAGAGGAGGAGASMAGGVTAGVVAGAFEGGRLYTWGDGDRYKLGHGDKQQQLLPKAVDTLSQVDISQVACGQDITVALTPSGHVYAMGSAAHGQLGNPQADGHSPALVTGPPLFKQIEQIACGTHHIAALTAASDLFTWGQGNHGQLGHGDVRDREVPTRVEAIKDQRVLSVSH